MNVDALISLGLWMFLCFVGLVFFLQRLRWKLGGRSRFGFYPSAGSLGNALQQLQVMAQPEVRYVLAEKLEEEADEDGSGDPDHPVDPVAHLHRQAARIRRGEEVDRITALLGR